MTELHDLLVREAESVEVEPGPPFESLAAKARQRRTTTRAACVAGAVIAVTAAIAIPNAMRSSPGRVVGPIGQQSPTSVVSAPATPVVTTGQCAGLTVVAVDGPLRQPIKPGPATNYLSLSVGHTVSLVTSGPCSSDIEYQQTQGSEVAAIQESSRGRSTAAASTVWAFTAKQQGSEDFTLELPPTRSCRGYCPMVATTTTITVIVDPPADKFHVGVSCKAGDLRWALTWRHDGLMLTGELTATNASGHDCDLLVKPRLAPLDADGKPLPADDLSSLELLVGPAVLKAGRSASSSILWSGWCGSPPGRLMRVSLDNGTSVDVPVTGPAAPGCPPSGEPTNLTSGWFGPLTTPSGIMPSAPSSYVAPSSGAAPASPYAEGGSPSSSGLS